MRTILHVTYRADREDKTLGRILLHKGIQKNLAHLHRKTLPGELPGITLQTIRHNLPGGIDTESPGGAQCDDDGGRLLKKLLSRLTGSLIPLYTSAGWPFAKYYEEDLK